MNLQAGQRWKNIATGMILEIMNPANGQCKVKHSGTNVYRVGYIDCWEGAFTSVIRRYNGEDTGKDYIFWEYMEGQDAPQ